MLEADGETTLAVWAAGAAVVSAGLWAVGTVLFSRVLSKRSGASPSAASANLFKNLLALAAFLLGWWILGGAAPDARSSAWLLASGVAGFALGDTCYFAALPRCGAHTTAMLGNLGPPLAVLLAFVLFGEALEPRTLLAMAVTLGGVLCVLTDPVRRAREPAVTKLRAATLQARRTGIGLATLAAVFQALAIVVGRGGFQGVGILPGSVVRLAGGVLGAFTLALGFDILGRGRAPVPDGERSHLASLARPWRERAVFSRFLAPAVVAAVLCLPLYGFAVREVKGGVAAVLFATTPLFTLPITRVLGERSGPRTVFGTLLGFAGVAGVLAFGQIG